MIITDTRKNKSFKLDSKRGSYKEYDAGNYRGVPIGERYLAINLDDNKKYELIFKSREMKFNINDDSTKEVFIDEIIELKY